MLEAAQAAEVLALLPEGIKDDIAKRIAVTEQIPESILSELEEVSKGSTGCE